MFNIKSSKMMVDIQWSFISFAISSFVHLLLRVVLGKELGPAGLGLYTLVFTIYLFGTQFAAFGIGSALSKYIAEHSDYLQRIRDFVSSGVIGSIITGSLMGLVLYLSAELISINFFHSPDMVDLLKVTAICFPFIAMQKSVIGTLNGLRKMDHYALVNILQNVSVLLFSIFLVIFLNMGVKGAVLGFVIPTIIVGTISLILVKEYVSVPHKLINTSLRELSWFGFYVVLANSVGMINTQIDSLLIGHFMDEVDVGYYAIAIIFMQGVVLVPHAVQRVTSPSMARYYGKGDYAAIQKLIKLSVIKTLGLILVISASMMVFGRCLINMLFTAEFSPVYVPMLILLMGYSVYAPYVSIGGYLASIGKVRIVFRISILCAFLNTLFNLALIPKLGIIGAATATSISLILTVLINAYFIKKYVFKDDVSESHTTSI